MYICLFANLPGKAKTPDPTHALTKLKVEAGRPSLPSSASPDGSISPAVIDSERVERLCFLERCIELLLLLLPLLLTTLLLPKLRTFGLALR